MKKNLIKASIILLLFIAAVACGETPKPIQDSRMNDYALFDSEGNMHRFSRYNNAKALVLFVQGNGCPMVRTAYPDYAEVAKKFEDEGFRFFMINANLQDTYESIQKEREEFGYDLPVLVDSVQILADVFDLRVTSEVLVLHPVKRTVIWRGPLSSSLEYETSGRGEGSSYLKEVLQAIEDDKPITTEQVPTKGCAITRLSDLEKAAGKEVSYVKDVAPILMDNCVECHNDFGMAPWSMKSHKSLVGWGQMIKQVLLSRRMPPWGLSPLTENIQDELSINEKDRRTLLTWLNEGMKKDDGEDPLLSFIPDTSEWEGGKPDTVIYLAPEEVPAKGIIPYKYQEIKLHNSQTLSVKAFEVKTKHKKALHHMLISTTSRNEMKDSPILDRAAYLWLDNVLLAQSGSQMYYEYPPGYSVKIRPGKQIMAQLHLSTFGKNVTEEIALALYFSDSLETQEVSSFSVINQGFKVEPFDPRSSVSATDVFKTDFVIFGVIPHQHFRGKEIDIKIKRKGSNKIENLIHVADFNFNWQKMYLFEKSIQIKKGDQLLLSGVFDNSFQNPLNPDPTMELRWGVQSADEMFAGMFFGAVLK